MAAGPSQQKLPLEWRLMWRDTRHAAMGPLRLAVLVIGIALIIGYLTAGVGGQVKTKPGPAVLQPASDSPAIAPVQLRLRDVSVPNKLQPSSRAKPKQDSSRQDSNATPSPTPTPSPSPAPTKPNSPSGNFDSVG